MLIGSTRQVLKLLLRTSKQPWGESIGKTEAHGAGAIFICKKHQHRLILLKRTSYI